MGSSGSKSSSSSNNSNCSTNQKELQDCQEEKARCAESNSAYAKDVAQYKTEQTKLKKENEEHKAKVESLTNKVKDLEAIVTGYVVMEEAVTKFCNDFKTLQSKKETFDSLSICTCDGVIVAIIAAIIGIAIVLYFFCQKKRSAYNEIDMENPSDVLEE